MNLSVQAAIDRVEEAFPFDGYMAGNYAPYHTVGEVVRRYLRPGQRLFDLGSGPCDKTAIAAAMGVECAAFDDLNDNWYRSGDNLARIQAFAEEFGIDLSLEFDSPASRSLDMVMMNDVLEHLHDSPRDLLESLVTGLNEDGLLFASVPNLANIRKRLSILRGRTNLPEFDLFYWYEGPWRGPVREYVRSDLELLSRFLGLEVVEIRTVHHMLTNLPTKAVVPYRAVTKIFPDWADTWVLVARKPAGWSAKDLSKADFGEIYERKSKKGLHA